MCERKESISEFNMKEVKAFVVTIKSESIELLEAVSEVLGLQLPDVKCIVTYFNGSYDFYLEFGRFMSHTFEVAKLFKDQSKESSEENSNEESVKEYAMVHLERVLNLIDWNYILARYIDEEGIVLFE